MKKNVAIIVQKLRGGGAERTASNLSLLLADEYNVHLIVFDGTDIKYPFAGQLHDLKIPPAKGKLGKLKNLIARVKAAKEIKKREKIDASISLMMGANLVNVMSRQGEKTITSVRNQMSLAVAKTKKQKIANKMQMMFIAKCSNFVVALSKGVEEDLVKNFGVPQSKVVTIYNSCDGAMLAEKASVHALDAAGMTEHCVTTMGRLNPQKGQWHLIRAFRKVVDEIPDAKLYILGQGELEEKLKALTSALNLDDNIIFLGFVEAPHAYIMKSRVFVFPSLFEGLGNVLLEAMVCGTPCIASDCFSGPREILSPGTVVKEQVKEIEMAEFGVLVSVGDKGHFNAEEPLTSAEEQLAESIKLLLTDDGCYKKYQAAAERRIKDFTPEKITKDWESILL